MTNFFGSVMEMIHTSSAYRMLSSKESKMDNSKMLRDQSGQDSQRILASSDVQNQFGDSNITDQQIKCPFTQMLETINAKLEEVKDKDSWVNYGLLLMIPMVGVFSWFSS